MFAFGWVSSPVHRGTSRTILPVFLWAPYLHTQSGENTKPFLPSLSLWGQRAPSSYRAPLADSCSQTPGRKGPEPGKPGRGEGVREWQPDPPQLFKHPGPLPSSFQSPRSALRPGSRPPWVPAVNTLQRFPPTDMRLLSKPRRPEGRELWGIHQGWVAAPENRTKDPAEVSGGHRKERGRRWVTTPWLDCTQVSLPCAPSPVWHPRDTRVPPLATYPFQRMEFLSSHPLLQPTPTPVCLSPRVPTSSHWPHSPLLLSLLWVSKFCLLSRPLIKCFQVESISLHPLTSRCLTFHDTGHFLPYVIDIWVKVTSAFLQLLRPSVSWVLPRA